MAISKRWFEETQCPTCRQWVALISVPAHKMLHRRQRLVAASALHSNEQGINFQLGQRVGYSGTRRRDRAGRFTSS